MSAALDRALALLAVVDNALRTDDETGADLHIDVATREGLLVVLGEIGDDISAAKKALKQHGFTLVTDVVASDASEDA